MLLLSAQALFRQRLTRAIALPLVLLLLLSGVSIWQIARLLSALEWVNHTDRVISQANRVQKLLLDQETGLRGYLLSEEQAFLAPYEQSRSQVPTALNELRELVSDNPPQVKGVEILKTRQTQWSRYAPSAIARRQRGEVESLVELRKRKQLMDAIRTQVSAFIATEEQLRNKRTQVAQQTTRIVILSSLGLTLLVGGILAYFIRQQLLKVSQSYEEALHTARVQTEQSQRTAQRLRDLHKLDRAILAAQSLETLTTEALSRLKLLVPYQQAAVLLFDFETNEARLLAEVRTDDIAKNRVPMRKRVPLALVRQEEPILYVENLENFTPRPSILETQLANGYCSFLSVALRVEDTSIGNLVLFAQQPSAFAAQERDVVAEVAAQLAIAIHQSILRKQLQTYASELEQRVSQRTAQLEEINRELEAFSYSVSHDLRAPLRTIQGFAQALLEDYADELDEEAKSYIDSIVDDAIHMSALIADLLAYSRLSRTQIHLQPVALHEVVQEALKQIKSEIEEKHAQITTAPLLSWVLAHRFTLVGAIVNLLTNAIKFVEPGVQPQVYIYTEEEYDRQQSWVRLSIVDNGIGIAPEHQERIFRVFERLHGVEIYPGTGIGLATVRKGLERMGGRGGVESQPGQGSRFWIALPKVVPNPSQINDEPASDSAFD